MSKEEIRKEKKLLRNMLTTEEQKALSKNIRDRLLKTSEYINCVHLFTFVSFGLEVDTLEIIHQAFKDQKKIYIPRVEVHGLEFYEIHSMEGLIASKFGVLEPQKLEDNRYKVNYQSNSVNLMLLPGLAFDPNGNRIGYGAGYYDRYLAVYPTEYFYKIALAYDFQIVNVITATQYDIKADAILTPSKRIRCRK